MKKNHKSTKRRYVERWHHSKNRTKIQTNKVKTNEDDSSIMIELLEEENQTLENKIDLLKSENEKLRHDLVIAEQSPTLSFGTEPEFYPGEARDILVQVLKEYMRSMQEGTRRLDIIKSIVNNNESACGEHIMQIKQIFKNYKDMSPSTKKALERLGFKITDEGKHYKVTYNGDGRYMTILSRTPSKRRATMEMANNIITMAM